MKPHGAIWSPLPADAVFRVVPFNSGNYRAQAYSGELDEATALVFFLCSNNNM